LTFKNLNLTEPLLRAVRREGYESPSPIQQRAIPLLLAGRDILGCAQTGTGKTAAFALPILQTLCGLRGTGAKRRVLRALVLTPTRELALQIAQSFRAYGRYTGLNCVCVFGGVSQTAQTDALRAGADILVATPGRLNDLIGQGLCDLSAISVFTLDEADRMLDMGFVHDVKRIIAKIPVERQTLLFSATMPEEIKALAASILKNPATVTVSPASPAAEAIEQSVYFVDKPNKLRLLTDLLADSAIASALTFSRTKHGADRICKGLVRAGINARSIHGDKSQNARQDALRDFKDGKIRVLVATDIAARGIDIDRLSHVINYDLPNEPETYVHRIGRTGRAGFSGIAISLCDFDEKAYLKDIQKLTGQEIPIVEEHRYPMQVFEPSPPKANRPGPKILRETAPNAKGCGRREARGKSGAPGTRVAAASGPVSRKTGRSSHGNHR
jgi:ATP-dependent RNA helicase RhlE